MSLFNRGKVSIADGTTGEVVKVSESGQLSVSAFMIEVAKGNVPGHSFDRKFGAIDSVAAATPADVWEYGITVGAEKYTFSADGVADIDTISSSSALDELVMTVDGLDINGDPVTQNATLNGQTKVVLATALWRVNRVFNSNGTDLAGNVYVYVDGAITGGIPDVVTTVRGFVSAGKGQTLQAVYTVPNGFTAYFVGLESSLTKGGGATTVFAIFEGSTREFGKVFRIQDIFNLISSGTSNKNVIFPIPLPFAAKTDFCPSVDVSANGIGVSWAFTVLLVEDGY